MLKSVCLDSEVLILTLANMHFLYLQDGNELPVAVKTCKEDNEESMTEKFLEEACKKNFCLNCLKAKV